MEYRLWEELREGFVDALDGRNCGLLDELDRLCGMLDVLCTKSSGS